MAAGTIAANANPLDQDVPPSVESVAGACPESIAASPAVSFKGLDAVGRLFRLSVDAYEALVRDGLLGPNERVELLEGVLVAKMTKYPSHSAAASILLERLLQLAPVGWCVRKEDPIRLATSMPEPDLALVRGTQAQYRERHPVAAEVAILVEIADSSLRDDQTLKKRMYATAAIPTYWIVNLPARRVEVYTDPTGPDPTPDYRRRTDHGPADGVPLVLDGQEVGRIAVADLLP